LGEYNVDVNYYYTISFRNTIEVNAKSKEAAESKVENMIYEGDIDPENEGWDSEIFDPVVEAIAEFYEG